MMATFNHRVPLFDMDGRRDRAIIDNTRRFVAEIALPEGCVTRFGRTLPALKGRPRMLARVARNDRRPPHGRDHHATNGGVGAYRQGGGTTAAVPSRSVPSPTVPKEIIMKISTLLALAGLAALPVLALAQGMQGGHSGHGAPAAAPGDAVATTALREINARMHRDMDIRYSNDVEVDFVRNMIPHHQGAIDMARIVLQHGKDEQVKTWAADVIREQQREIDAMQKWLKAKSK